MNSHLVGCLIVLAALGACDQSAQVIDSLPDRLGPGDVAAGRGDLRIGSQTRLLVWSAVDPALARQLDLPTDKDGSAKSLTYALRNTFPSVAERGGLERQRTRYDREHGADGKDILITQHIGMTAKSAPYRIVLTARKGNKVWTRSVERPDGERPDIIDRPPQRVGKQARTTIALGYDSRELAESLAKALEI